MTTQEGQAKVAPEPSPGREANQYDVALSFAGEDRRYVDRVAQLLRGHNVSVFYDGFEEAKLWGQDLYVYLTEVYSKRARFCVMFLSKAYAAKAWTNHERAAAQQRAFEAGRDYILPARFDDTEIPGIRSTTGYIDLRQRSPEELVALILQKLGSEQSRDNEPPPVPVDDVGRRWLLKAGALGLAVALSMFGIVRAQTKKPAAPHWLTAEFLPTVRDVHRNAADLDTAWGKYTKERPATATIFQYQLEDLAFAVNAHNDAFRAFSVRVNDFRTHVTALWQTDPPLAKLADDVFACAALKFHPFDAPPAFDAKKDHREQLKPILANREEHADKLRAGILELDGLLRRLQCEILRRAGAAVAECELP